MLIFYIILIAVVHRSCCDFEIDQAANVRQILCNTAKIATVTLVINRQSFGKESRIRKVQLTEVVKGEKDDEQSQK
jgi:hypothetical protein